MSKQNSSALESLAMAANATAIDALQQSYAVATEITKNVITRYGNHDSAAVIKYWTELSDGIAKKIKADMKEVLG